METRLPLLLIWTSWQTGRNLDLTRLLQSISLRPLKIRSHAGFSFHFNRTLWPGNHLRKTIPDAVTIPQHFAKYGYKTESLGKIFHIGHGNFGDP